MPSPLFPVALKLEGRRVLVVGAGPIAWQKAGSLLDAGARVRLVAPESAGERSAIGLERHRRLFRPADLDGCWLVVTAATSEVNREVSRLAETRRVFTIAVDDPSSSSAYNAAVLRRSGVAVAVSTDGAAPALAGLLREALDELLPAELESWLRTAVELRARWRHDGTAMVERRPLLLRALNRLYEGRASS